MPNNITTKSFLDAYREKNSRLPDDDAVRINIASSRDRAFEYVQDAADRGVDVSFIKENMSGDEAYEAIRNQVGLSMQEKAPAYPSQSTSSYYDANEKAPDSVIYQYMGENPDEEYRNFMANARKERANEQYKKDLAAYEQRNKEFKASIPAVPNDMSILDNLEEGGSMSQEQKDDYAAEAAHLKQGISKEVYEDYVQRRDAFIDKYHPSENGYALSPDAPKLEGSQQYEYFENTKKKVQAELAERGVNISLDHPDMDILAARKILHDKKEAQQRLEKTKSNKKSYNAKYAPIADNNTRVVNGMVMVDGADRLTAAYNHFADKTIDLLEKEWIGDESFGGFMGAFWDALKDPNEICFGLPEMFSEGKMTELLKKQILYDNLNDKERETLQAYFDYVEAMLLRADSISKTARAGESAGMSMQFMGTMAVSGGIWSLASKGAGKLATKFFAPRIMKAFKLKDLATAEARMARFFEKGVEWENVNKRIAGMESGAAKVAAKVGAELGDVGTSLAGTLWNGGGITLSSPGTYVKAYRDAIEHIDVDDYGKVVLKGPAYDNIFYASLAQIMGGESYWENTGEQSGGFMMKLLSKAGKWSGLAAMMQYIRNVKGIGAASGKIANTWDAIQDFVSVPKAFTDTFKMGGMIEESLEELFSATGTYLTKCVKGECSEKDLEEYLDFFDPENLEVLFMSFATIPVMGGIASTGNLGYTKGKLKSAKDMAYMYTQDFMTDNQIEAAMSAIDNMDAKDMAHGISRLVKDSNLSAREKTVLGQVLTNYGCAKISNDKWYNSEAAGEQVDDIRSGINERNERMGNMYNAALLKSAGVEVDDASMQDIKEYAEARGLNNYDLEAAIKGIDTEAGADTIRDIEQFRNEKQLAAQLQSQYAENCVEGTRSYQAVSKGAQNGHIVAYSSDGISATVSWDGENGSTVEQVPLSQLQFGESIENVDQFIADRISGQQAKYDQAESYRVGDIFIVQESYEGKQHGEEVEEKEAPHGIKQLKSFENGIFEFDDGTTLAEEQLVANPEAMTPMFEVGNERFKDDEGNIISVVNRQVHATDNQFGENQHGDSYWVNVISPEGQTTSKLMTSDELWTAMATSQYSDGYTYVNMLSEGMKKLVPADVINEAHNRAQRNAADKERGGKVDDLEAGEQITVADENSEDGGMSTLTYKGKEGDMLVFEDENGNKVLKNPVKDAREIQEGRNAQRERDAQQNTDDEGHQAEVRKTAESFTETYSEPLDAFESCLQTLNDAKSKAEKLAAEASKVVPIRNDRDKQAIKRKREAAQKAQQDVDFYNEVAHYIPTMTGHTFEEFADMLAEKSGKKTKGRKKTTETKETKPENKGVTRKPAQTKAGERYQATPKIEGRRGTMTLRNGQKVKGHYVLTTPDSLTPSHDPRNRFLKHPDFPVNDKGETINDRDYEASKDNQGHVIRIGQKYDGQAIENVPVISSEGIVYSGNNRTMSGQLAADNNTDSEYIESLKENAEGYGLSSEDIDSMEHPRLVFELDEELPYDTNTMKLFNQNNEKPQDAAEKAVAISKRLTERNIIDIANILEGYSTLESIYNAKGEASDLMNYLLRKKIISEMDITGFMKGNGKLSDEGKKFVDTLLLGTLFDAKEVRLIMDMPDEKLRLMRAFKSIMQNYKLGNDFNLKNELNEAVRLLSDLKSGKLNMEEFLYQQRIDGKVGSDDYSSFALMIANAVKTNLDTLRDVVNSYNMEAENSASGMNDIFSQRIIPKEEIIDKVLRNLLDNNEYNSGIGNELRKRIQQKDGRAEQEQPAATKPATGQGNAETKPSVPSIPAGDGKGKAQKGGTEKVSDKIASDAKKTEHGDYTVSIPSSEYDRLSPAALVFGGDTVTDNKDRKELHFKTKEAAQSFSDYVNNSDSKLSSKAILDSLRKRSIKVKNKDYKSTSTPFDINGTYTIADIEKFFRTLTDDADLNKIADLVFGIAKQTDVPVLFGDKLSGFNTYGFYMPGYNVVAYDLPLLDSLDNNTKARVVLHEIIHAATSNTLLACEDGKYDKNSPVYKAYQELESLFKAVKKTESDTKSTYGFKSIEEFVAELASKEFRGKLKEKNLWEKVIKGIRNFFAAMVSGGKETNALENADRILNTMCDLFTLEDFHSKGSSILVERGDNVSAENEVEQKPLRKGDCVEYEGKKWKVSRVIGGKASLTEINSKGKAGSIKENVPVSDLKQIEAPKNLAFSLGDTSTYNGMTSQAAHVADNARKLAETMGISAKVISDVSQIPASEQQAIDSIKKGLAVRAWVGTDGTMYIYGPQLSKEGVTAKEMEALLFHEGVAHIGVRKLMGAESGAFYQAVWNFMGQANRKEMLKYVFQTRTDVAEWNKAVSTPADKRTKEQTKLIFEVQNHAADEYVAHMAEKIGKKEAEKSELTKAFDEVCDWVRRKLGKLGFKFTGSLTREDIAKAIMASRRNITGQKFEGNTEERFSVNHYGEEKPYHNDKYPISDRQAIFREFNRNTYDKPGTDIYIIGDYAYSVDHYVSEGYLDGSKSNYIVGLGIRGRIKITKLPKAKYNEFINAYKNNDVHDRRSYNNWLKEHGADTTSNLSNNVDNNDRKTNVRDDKLAISEYRQEEGRSSNNDDSRRDTESEQLNELFSIADRLDRRKNDYNKALANNDETAMRVALDAIARLNGYEYNGYHNSMSDFDVFEDGHRGNRPEHSLDEVAEAGWFSNEPNKEYGAKAYHSYIRMKNPYTIYGNSERAKAINDEIQKIVEARSAEKNGANRRGVIAALNKRKAELEEEYNSIEPFRRLQAEAKAVFDKYPEAKTYGEAFRIHATKHGYDGVKFVDTATDGKYGQDWYMPFKAGNNIKSADLVTRDDNDNVIPVEKRFSNSPSIRFSISPKQDADYKKAVESGDMETAQKMVDEAAKATGANFVSDVNGNLKTLFHGTNKFGFTTFRSKRPSGAMFTVDKSAVSANYGGDDNYAGKRRINQGYVESSATDTVLRNAKSVFGQPWRRATQEERNAVVKKMEVDAQRVMQRMDSLKEKSSNLPEEISNAVSWVEDIIYTAATGRENGNEGAEMQRLLSDGYEKFREYRDVVKEYYNDNYDNLDNPTKEYLRCIVGYELGDVAIDAGLSGAKAFAEEDILTVTGDNFLNTKELHDNVRQAHSVGSYQLYGDLGSNPLVVECNDKNWYDLDFNGMSSTDDIVEWANEHGYTSVEFRNIYDYGDKANVYAFFEPSSLKSADPVTYDDKGEVIPLSERFNPNKQDIRFSIANNGNNNTNQEHPLTERVESMRNSLDDILEELKNLSGKDDLSVLGRAHLKAIRKLLKEGEDVGTQVKEVGKSSVKQRMEKVRQLKQLVDALAKAIPNGSTVVKSHAANMIKKSIAIGAIPTKRNLEEFANDVYDFAQVVINNSMKQSLDKLMSKPLTKKDGNDTKSLSSYSRTVHRTIQEFSPSKKKEEESEKEKGKKKNSRTEEAVDKEIEKVKEQLVALNTAVANHELTFTDKTGATPVVTKIDTDTLVKRYQTILPAKLAGLQMAKRMHQIEKLRKSVGSATASINERGITADEKRARKCDRREIRDDLISAEETMIRDWKAVLAEGKANKDQQVYATEQAELNEQAFKAISYDLRGVTPRENAQKPSKFGKLWHELNGAGARSMEYMLNKLARLSPAGEGETFKLVFNLWSKARNQEIIRKKQITDTLTKKAKEIFKEKVKPGENPAKAQSLIKNINELAGLEKQLSGAVMYREASNANYELEIGQLAMLYAWSKQDGAKEKLAATHVFMDEIPPRPHDGKTNLTADEMKEQKEWDETYAHGVQLKDLLQHLPQEWKDWMDYLQSDFLPTYRQEYNPVFEARHGRPMPDIENYFPFRIAEEENATVSEQNLDNVNGVREMLNQAASAEIDRVSNCKSFDVVNQSAMSILSAHINEMEKVYNYNQLTEVLKSIITNNNIANRMNAIDKYTYKDFVKACQVVTGLGYNPTKDTNAFEYAVGRLTQSLARTKIGGKIWTALKQFESSIIYLDDIISDREFAKTYFNPAEMRHAWSFAQKNLPQLMERWQSKQLGDQMLNVSKFGSNSVTDKSRYRNQTARALAETFDNLGNLSNETSKLLMTPNAAVDFLTCSLGAYAKYKSEYKHCKALGMSDAVAHNNAVNAAQHIVNRSQQSQEAFYISPFQMNSSIISTFANVFRNSAYAYGRILRQSAKDLIKWRNNSQQFWDGIEESVRRDCERNGITDPAIIQGEIIRRKTRAGYKLWTTPLATVLVTTGWEFCQYGAWELAQALNGDDGDDDETKAKAQKEIDAAAKVLEEAKKKLSEAQGEEAKKEAEENVKAAEKALESANNNYDKRMKAVHKQRMDMLKSGLLSAAINLMGSGVPYTQYVASAITAVVDADRVAGNFTQWEKFLSTFSPTSMMSGDVSSMASRFNRAIDVKDATGLTYAAADAILSLTGTVDLDVITNAVAGACALYQSNDNLSAANISYALSEIINAPTATKDAFIYAIRNGEDELETMGRICAYVLWQQRMGVKGELSRIPKKYFEKTNMMLPDMLDENIIDENGITITIKQNNILINTLLQMENTDRTLISLVQGTKEYQEASKYVDIQLALQENEWTWGFPTWFFTGQLFPSQQKQEEEQE